MIRGIYTAASGMIAEMERNDTIANNLANAGTNGYKRDVAVTKDFANLLIERIDDGPRTPVGSMGLGTTVDAVITEHTAGTVKPTDNPLDLALDGPGFFTIETPAGVRYTRDGNFTRSSTGQLVTQDGYRVMGQAGPIQLMDGKVAISPDGRVLVDNVEVGQLRLADFADPRQLQKEGDVLYAAGNAAQTPFTGTVQQGALENSNVNVVAEMVNMINGYRAYEVNAKVVQTHDELLDKAVNSVGQV